MKFTKYAFIAAGMAMLASCSSDEPVNKGNEVTGTDAGYAMFNVSLPTVGGTRANSYEQGDAQEYAVTNGRVLVFQKGTTEADAKFVCMADLTGMNWSTGQAGEITTNSTCVAKLSNINLSDNGAQYVAAIVLNYNPDTFKFPSEGRTYGEWSKTAVANNMQYVSGGKTYLTMTNAARFKSATEDPTILVDINKSMIAQTETSIQGSAATFHVQRAVAKVKVAGGTFDVSGSSYQGDKVTINAWALDITNKTTFPMQVCTGLKATYNDIWAKARFSGAENSAFRRAFWAIDPNYDKDITTQAQVEENFNVIGNTALSSNPSALYCLENTFNIAHQKQGQTTRVVFKGKYVPSSIPGYTAGATFFKIGNSTALWIESTLKAEIEAKAKTVMNSNDVTVDLGTVATKAGSYSINDISIKRGGNDISEAQKNAVAAALGLRDASEKGIGTYLNGDCYYVARIKHFGDDETPWSIGNPTYGGDNEKYLGRYGIVRNTIYDVTVNSISNPGVPSVPEIKPDEPDDESNYYIQVNVNVLSWAKRVNNVDL